MKKIYVLYDSRCGLCASARSWVLAQPAHLAIEFIAAGSERARQLFPALPHDENPAELLVVTEAGDVYAGDAAWIVCLFALVEYRNWSHRLARPPLRRLARKVWETLSSNRQQISAALALKSDAELAKHFEAQPMESCETS
jgi:predicted DCC family thiol-disulfide oxidoreductase YuxK